MLDEVILACGTSRDTFTAAVLAAVGVERQPLDVAVVADRDRVRLLGDEIFVVNAAEGLVDDRRAPLVAVLVAQLHHIGPDQLEDVPFAAQQFLVP